MSALPDVANCRPEFSSHVEEGLFKPLVVTAAIQESFSVGSDKILAVDFFQGSRTLPIEKGHKFVFSGQSHTWSLNLFNPKEAISVQLSFANQPDVLSRCDITDLTRRGAAAGKVSLGTLMPFMCSKVFQVTVDAPVKPTIH